MKPWFQFLVVMVILFSAFVDLTFNHQGIPNEKELINQIFWIGGVYLVLLGMVIRAHKTNGMARILTTAIVSLFWFALFGNLFALIIGGIVTCVVVNVFETKTKTFAHALLISYLVLFFGRWGAQSHVGGISFYQAFTLDFIQEVVHVYWPLMLGVAIAAQLFKNGLPKFSLPTPRPRNSQPSSSDDDDDDHDNEPVVTSRNQRRKASRNNGVFNRLMRGVWEKLERMSRT